MYKLFLKVFKYILKKINKIPFVYKTREGERERKNEGRREREKLSSAYANSLVGKILKY